MVRTGHLTVPLRASPCGSIFARLEPEGANVAPFVPDFGDSEFPLLSLVDPYGNTFFSSYQMAGVIPEIAQKATKSAEQLLSQLMGLAITCRDRPHSYLVFIGD